MACSTQYTWRARKYERSGSGRFSTAAALINLCPRSPQVNPGTGKLARARSSITGTCSQRFK